MSGTTTITVNAAANLAARVGAHIRLVVDGKTVGSTTVNSTKTAPYKFSAALVLGQGHDIQVVYDNDATINGQDRNLLLQSIQFNGTTIQATDPSEVYHATGGPGDIASDGNMYWNGTAEFKLPSSDFPAPTPPSPPAPTPPSPPPPAPTPPSPPAPTPPSPPAPTPTNFYVSASGSDGGDGSMSHPFATLAKAQAAMEASSSIHTTYVEAGTYALTSALTLGSVDSGFSFLAAPGATPVITAASGSSLTSLISANGANNLTLTGLSFTGDTNGTAVWLQNGSGEQVTGDYFNNNQEGIRLIGTSSSTVSGNEIDNSSQSAVEVQDGSNKDVFDSNVVKGVGATETGGGAFYLHGTDSDTISHNQISTTAGAGISLQAMDGYNNTPVLVRNTNDTISGNVITNAGTASGDTGGIYVIDRTEQSTGISISDNEVNGMQSSVANAHLVGIYLDDFTSGVQVTGNIVRDVSAHDMQFHGGQNDVVSNNIFDTSSYGSGSNNGIASVLYQAAPSDVIPDGGVQPATGDQTTGNIFVSDQSSPQAYALLSWPGAAPVSNNLYYDPSGTFQTSPDTSPKSGNPGFVNAAGDNYAVSSGSAASPSGFATIDQSSMGLHPSTTHWYS